MSTFFDEILGKLAKEKQAIDMIVKESSENQSSANIALMEEVRGAEKKLIETLREFAAGAFKVFDQIDEMELETKSHKFEYVSLYPPVRYNSNLTFNFSDKDGLNLPKKATYEISLGRTDDDQFFVKSIIVKDFDLMINRDGGFEPRRFVLYNASQGFSVDVETMSKIMSGERLDGFEEEALYSLFTETEHIKDFLSERVKEYADKAISDYKAENLGKALSKANRTSEVKDATKTIKHKEEIGRD